MEVPARELLRLARTGHRRRGVATDAARARSAVLGLIVLEALACAWGCGAKTRVAADEDRMGAEEERSWEDVEPRPEPGSVVSGGPSDTPARPAGGAAGDGPVDATTDVAAGGRSGGAPLPGGAGREASPSCTDLADCERAQPAIDQGFVFPTTGLGIETTDMAWMPPMENHGGDGWEQSDAFLCTQLQATASSLSIWSDARGVFVLVSGGDSAAECAGCNGAARAIYQNDGYGWRSVCDELGGSGRSTLKLRGFVGGPLLVAGQDDNYAAPGCGLSLVNEAGMRTCEPVFSSRDAFVAAESLAYAIAEGDLLRYQDGAWGPLSALLPEGHALTGLWADEEVVFAITSGLGKILTLQNAEWSRHETGTVEQFTAIWGFSADDVWAGTASGGIHHFDGSEWREANRMGDGAGSCQRVEGMWGSDGVLYVHTGTALARIVEDSLEMVGTWPCDAGGPRIRSIWGDGPEELFVAIDDPRQPRRPCGLVFIIQFDGERFHRF